MISSLVVNSPVAGAPALDEEAPVVDAWALPVDDISSRSKRALPNAAKIRPKACLDSRMEYIRQHGEDSVPRVTPKPITILTFDVIPMPQEIVAMAEWDEGDSDSGKIHYIDAYGEKPIKIDEVIVAIARGDPKWQGLFKERKTALLNNEGFNTEDEEFIVDKVHAIENKRTPVEAGFSSSDAAAGRPQHRSKPTSGLTCPRRKSCLLSE
ncbi:hypothetical protein KCU99_g7482, partial [Aureobasidium melanogenum]